VILSILHLLALPEVWDGVQAATVSILALLAGVAGVWAVAGRPTYKKINGWFDHLDGRLNRMEGNQHDAQIERESDRRAQEIRDEKLTLKMDHMTAIVDRHEGVLYGSGDKKGLIEEMAYMRGHEDARKETAQLANAAATFLAPHETPKEGLT
jgi:hypothetical protein